MKAAVTAWVDLDMALKIKKEAEKQGLSPSALVTKFIEEALK